MNLWALQLCNTGVGNLPNGLLEQVSIRTEEKLWAHGGIVLNFSFTQNSQISLVSCPDLANVLQVIKHQNVLMDFGVIWWVGTQVLQWFSCEGQECLRLLCSLAYYPALPLQVLELVLSFPLTTVGMRGRRTWVRAGCDKKKKSSSRKTRQKWVGSFFSCLVLTSCCGRGRVSDGLWKCGLSLVLPSTLTALAYCSGEKWVLHIDTRSDV